jgi:23S rRNA (cytosine1962-C5)-methyltransferase
VPALHGDILWGDPLTGGVPFLETGFHFEAFPVEGHKTGFYLDQRENRRKLEAEVGGGRLLNVFGHTGAFSLYAVRGGAREVITVDTSAPALRQAERHFARNREVRGVADCLQKTLRGDAFEVMRELARAGERYDTVVVDPPSFTRSWGQRERAIESYSRLARLAVRLLRPGGLLVHASCSARVEAEAFFEAMHAGAQAEGVHLEETARTGHPPDHPVGFPEGAYLKCLWARVRTKQPAPRPEVTRGRGRARGGSGSGGRS